MGQVQRASHQHARRMSEHHRAAPHPRGPIVFIRALPAANGLQPMETNMFAYIVGHDHIDALLTFATADDPQASGRSRIGSNRAATASRSGDEPTDVGRILLTETSAASNIATRATTICPARSARKRLATRSAVGRNASAGRNSEGVRLLRVSGVRDRRLSPVGRLPDH